MDKTIELRPTLKFSVYCYKSQKKFDTFIKSSKERRGWIDFDSKVVSTASLGSKELPFVCPACNAEGGSQRSATTNIPHFKGVTILSFVCEQCFFKTNEIKADNSSDVISPTGMRWELQVRAESDMHRDLVKAKTARINIPELGFEMSAGSLGGLYTTVEGLLKQIHDRLKSSNPLTRGDIADSIQSSNFTQFLDRLHSFRSGLEPFTIIMIDPMNESFIFSTATENNIDSQLKSIAYLRSEEEEEECGLVAGDIGLDPEYVANLKAQGDPIPKPSDWKYTNDEDLTHNRFANFEQALIESLGVDNARQLMEQEQPWEERVQGTDFGVEVTEGGDDY